MKKSKRPVFKIIFLFLFINHLFSCESKTVDSTKVTITMPDLTTSKSISSKSSSTDNPSQINDVNCFAVMVGAQDPLLSRTTCAIKTESASGTETIIGEKKVGIIRGLIPSGGTIVLDVPPGLGRKFTLIGLKASALSACLDFADPNSNLDLISDPFIIGESTPVNLEPGIEVTVPIKLPASGTAFTSSSPKIGDCTGPDTPRKNNIIPTRAIVSKNTFPLTNFKESSCNPITIEFVDDLGRNGELSESFSAQIQLNSKTASGSLTTEVLNYSNNSDCSNPSEGGISFDKNINSRSKQIYFSTTAVASATEYALSINSFSATQFPSMTSDYFTNNTSSTVALDIQGARRVISDVCYNMQGKFKHVGGDIYTNQTVERFKIDTTDLNQKIYTGQDCQILNRVLPTSVSSTAQSDLVTTAGFNFSMKFSDAAYKKTFVKLTPIVSSASATTIVYPVEVFGGIRNPAGLSIEMYNTFPANGSCSGPFSISIINERGGVVPITSGTINVTVSSTAVGNIHLKEVGCGSTLGPSLNSPDNYRKSFAIYNTTVSTGTEADIVFTATLEHPLVSQTVILNRTQKIKFQ